MKTFNGLSFARVNTCMEQRRQKDKVMNDNFFILMDVRNSFGTPVIMGEVSTSSFF